MEIIKEKFDKIPLGNVSIWTIRVTPPESVSVPETDGLLTKFLDATKGRYLLFREKSRYQRVHYHARFEWAFSKSKLYSLKQLALPNYKGNGMFSFHSVYYKQELYDDNLWKSATYIAKDGNLIANKGYPPEDVKLLTELGNQFKARNGKTKLSKFINEFKITELPTHELVPIYLEYHNKNSLNLPPFFKARQEIEQIQLMTNKFYFNQYKDKLMSLSINYDF